MKFEQLHDALEQTQLALLKERKKTMKLRKLLLEAAERENNKEEKVSTVVGRAETAKKTEKKKAMLKTRHACYATRSTTL